MDSLGFTLFNDMDNGIKSLFTQSSKPISFIYLLNEAIFVPSCPATDRMPIFTVTLFGISRVASERVSSSKIL